MPAHQALGGTGNKEKLQLRDECISEMLLSTQQTTVVNRLTQKMKNILKEYISVFIDLLLIGILN